MSLIFPTTAQELLDHLYDSMRGGTDTAIGGLGNKAIAQNGGLLPMPDSKVKVSSYESMRASILAGNGTTFFADGVNQCMPWLWVYAAAGHASTQAYLECADGFTIVRRRSTGVWQVVFKGARWLGQKWDNESPVGGGDEQDLQTNGNVTIVRPYGGRGYEMWPIPSTLAPNIYSDVVNRTAFSDFDCVISGGFVRVVGPDKNLSRFIGDLGNDFYRSDAEGRRYYPDGFPQYVMDGNGARWRIINNTGAWQLVTVTGVGELGAYDGAEPPWASYASNTAWIYNDAPTYSRTWAQIQAEAAALWTAFQTVRVYTAGSTPAPAPAPAPNPAPSPSPGPAPAPAPWTNATIGQLRQQVTLGRAAPQLIAAGSPTTNPNPSPPPAAASSVPVVLRIAEIQGAGTFIRRRR